MRIRSLGQGDPLEEGMATHSSILAWRIPWTERLVGYTSQTSESDTTEAIQHIHMCACIKQITNENLLYSTGKSAQCSVETQMDKKSKKEGTMYIYS